MSHFVPNHSALGAKLSNYYEILNVAREADQSAIRAAYRALILEYHPDTGRTEAAAGERASKMINEAYSVLGNEQHRAAYDRNLGAALLTGTTGRKWVPPLRSRRVPRPAATPVRLPKSLLAAMVATAGVILAVHLDGKDMPLHGSSARGDLPILLPHASLAQHYHGGQGAVQDELSQRATQSSFDDGSKLEPAISRSGYERFDADLWPSISQFDDEDLLTVQLSCSTAQGRGRAGYQKCLTHYSSELSAGATYPLRIELSDELKSALEVTCAARRMDGPASYNGCLKGHLRSLNVSLGGGIPTIAR